MWWQLLLLWIGISVIPYGMFLVAWVFESRAPGRDVPIWRGQSKAFVPGDLGLSLAAASGITVAIHEGFPPWAVSWWWWLMSGCAVVVALYLGRRVLYVPSDYTREAWNSPTKRYHDVVMFGMFSGLAFAFVVPMYAQGWSGDGIFIRMAGILGTALWASGVAWDALHHEVPNARQHPSQWKPLWR